MTKQQFDDLYLGKAVHCDTEEKANEFLALAHSFGYKWCSGESLLDFIYYYEYQKETAFLVDNVDGFEFSHKDYYIEGGYTIVKFGLEPIEETFNVGDVVYNKEGKKLVIKDVMYYTVDDNNVYHNVEPYELSKTKPLQKITREELAEKGYELVD